MTQEQLNAVVFYIQNGEIVESTYKQYLNEYGQDLTTSPRGVEDRMHIREINKGYEYLNKTNNKLISEEEYDQLTDELTGDELKEFIKNHSACEVFEYQIWSWGVNGNHPHYTGTSFDNEEDAELYYYERSEWYVSEKNWNAPQYFGSKEEAEADLIQTIADGESIDFKVAQSIYRKAQKVAARRAELKAIAQAEHTKRRAEIKAAVPIEADSIAIDDEFKTGVQEMVSLAGGLKSKHAEKIMAELLSRNGRTAIESDFWQVFRILKARAEK